MNPSQLSGKYKYLPLTLIVYDTSKSYLTRSGKCAHPFVSIIDKMILNHFIEQSPESTHSILQAKLLTET